MSGVWNWTKYYFRYLLWGMTGFAVVSDGGAGRHYDGIPDKPPWNRHSWTDLLYGHPSYNDEGYILVGANSSIVGNFAEFNWYNIAQQVQVNIWRDGTSGTATVIVIFQIESYGGGTQRAQGFAEITDGYSVSSNPFTIDVAGSMIVSVHTISNNSGESIYVQIITPDNVEIRN